LSEEAPYIHGLAHATDHLHLSESLDGPEQFMGGNEDNHSGDSHIHLADARTYEEIHALDNEAQLFQPSTSLDYTPEESPYMFASLLDVLSSFSPGSLSRSPSTSSSSSSVPVLSPDHQTQWGGDSPSRSPNRSSSEESVPADLSFDDDIEHPRSKSFEFNDGHSQSIDYFSIPGSFSMVDNFQPGTSAGTIRPPVNPFVPDGISTPPEEDWPSTFEDYATPELDETDIFDQHHEHVEETVDGHGHDHRTNPRDDDFGGHQSSNERGNSGNDRRHVNAGGTNNNGWGSSGDGRRGGGGDDHRKDDRAPSMFSSPSDTENEASEEEDAQHPTRQSHSDTPSTSDDDVPLAQSIPTALRAQRTIQKQVRDEKDERRRRRALQRQQQLRQPTHNQTPPNEQSRHLAHAGPASLQGPSQPTPSFLHATRPRTKTLPSNTSRPVVAEDLARRLKDIQDLNSLSVSLSNRHQYTSSDAPAHSDQPERRRSGDHARAPNIGFPDKSIRPTRSFHRASPATTAREEPMPIPPIIRDTHRLGRSATTVSSRVKQHDQPEIPAHATPRSRSKSTRRPRTSDGAQQPSATPFSTSVSQRVTSLRTAADLPDASPLPPTVPRETRQVSWQQRVFIVDLQRFNTIMMSPTTTAKDVIDALDTQGQLANWAGVDGWMLFEVSQDFGMGWWPSSFDNAPYLANAATLCRETNPPL
jgi:hypothetical protein